MKKSGEVSYYDVKEPYTNTTPCGCHHGVLPYDGKLTYTVYRTEGSPQKLPVAAAYIVSHREVGEWTLEKQKAFWNLRDSELDGVRLDEWLIEGGKNSENDGPTDYDQEAIDYAPYDKKVRNDGLQISNKTDLETIKTDVNQKTKEYTIGPFNIDYIKGKSAKENSEDVTFSGISKMTVIGYNSKGEKVRDDIKIEKIILTDMATKIDGKAVEPEYFEPSEKLKVDETKQVYPEPKQDFKIIFKDPNEGLDEQDENRIASISLKIKFKYMLANGEYQKFEGTKYGVRYEHNKANQHTEIRGFGKWTYLVPCYDCKATRILDKFFQQDVVEADAIRSIYELEYELPEEIKIPIKMNLGGHVWEDVPAGKENLSDGISGILQGGENATDRALPNVKVTLYTSDGEVAKLLSDPEAEDCKEEDVTHRINPTYTDSKGNYLFEGLNPMKKYYVQFEYNGQIYMPTDYLKAGDKQYGSVKEMVNAGLYNTNTWKITSKATEGTDVRNSYNGKFAEIKSSPLNYTSSNSLKLDGNIIKDGQNQTFSQYDLMGFVLNGEGKYDQSGVALIDGFYKINDKGDIEQTDTIQEGIISRKIKEYIKENKKSPDENAIKEIYGKIVSENSGKDSTELWRKLQFIEDCKIKTETQAQGQSHDLYPVYDTFTTNYSERTDTSGETGDGKYPTAAEEVTVRDGVRYEILYPGQYFVNLGLWRRHQVDMGLRKDILYAATRINGETEVYKYDKRATITKDQQKKLDELKAAYSKDRTNMEAYNKYIQYKEEIENKAYWSIELRMQDYANYYGSGYNRELYEADYNQVGKATNGGSDLELYVTYKITVRNSSESILGQITEVVDYYDKDYTYIDKLSWVMYKNDSNSSDNAEISVTEEDYFNTIDKLQPQIPNAKKVNSSYNTRENRNGSFNGESIYGEASKSDMEKNYNSVYVGGLSGKKLASGEEAYIYLTFKVNPDSKGPVILDDENSLKQNFAEINGYKTFYRDGTQLPNGITKGSNDAAGIIDYNSNPGNLCLDDLKGERYEKNFENDTDRAKSIQVKLYDDDKGVRIVNGVVWNDERTETVSNSAIGNGVLDVKNGKQEIGVKGVTVELVEKLAGGREYVWQTTNTGTGKGKRRVLKTGAWQDYSYDNKSNGYYEFSGSIPGNYIVRFYYGHNNETVLTTTNGISYNGQDFKSTVYQKNVKTGQEISSYNAEKYDIKKADEFNAKGIRFSDAKDLWENKTINVCNNETNYQNKTLQGRTKVIGYSNSKVTNHKAEVLASPYTKNNSLINELIANTNMVAETALINLKGEYNRNKTDGDKNTNNGEEYYSNKENGDYTLSNLDFGLTERPKAQLELSKKITKFTINLANGSVLFDTTGPTTDVIWMGGKQYDLSVGDDNKYDDFYNDKDPYAYRDNVKKTIDGLYDNSNASNGLISISMDEELMHGATIKINYELTVKNVGEIDYTGKDFYYKATGAANKVTTAASVLLDYVSNNLQFRQVDNKQYGWKATTNITEQGGNVAVSKGLSESIKKYNTTITTEALASKLLKPGEQAKTGLVLSQLLTPQNIDDDRTYNNIAEIVSITNNVGRRMAYSIQGNQDPTDTPQEVDSAKSEKVIVGKPTGIGEIVVYIAVITSVLAILIVGIVFIKKKVLNK